MVKKTQTQIVLEELKESGRKGITSWDMITKHHITRLASCICILRKRGYTIYSERCYRDDKMYARYWLREDA